MWLYPVPVAVALVMWICVFVSAPASGQLFAAGFVALGVVSYFGFTRGTPGRAV
jgi:hypothetical protein